MVNSRLISRPTTRKKTVSKPSSTQCSNDIRKSKFPNVKPKSVCQNASKAGPSTEFVSPTASTEASSNKTPVEGAQLAKLSAAVRTRYPSGASIASEKEFSSQGPS